MGKKDSMIIKCQKCGYEFLCPVTDPCPKCGYKNKITKKELAVDLNGVASLTATTQKETKKTYRIVEVISIAISLISAVFCYFIDPLFGLIIGLLVLFFTYFLGKKYVETRIIEKDHYQS